MATSMDLRRRVVVAYRSGRTATYEAKATMFGIGLATVNRILRRHRETGDSVQAAWRQSSEGRRLRLVESERRG